MTSFIINGGFRFSLGLPSLFGNRLRDGAFNAPFAEAISHRGQRNANASGPRRYAQGNPVVGVIFSPSCILSLLKIILPSTVVGAVRSVAILSAHGMIGRWLRAHVFQKYNNSHGSTPLIANGYSPAAVILVILVGLCVAAPQHALPVAVSIWIFSIVIKSMYGCVDGRLFGFEAPAGLSMPASQVANLDNDLIPAHASTTPKRLWGLPAVNFYGKQSPEGLPGEVGYFSHNAVDLILSRCVKNAGRLTTAMKQLFGVSPYPALTTMSA